MFQLSHTLRIPGPASEARARDVPLDLRARHHRLRRRPCGPLPFGRSVELRTHRGFRDVVFEDVGLEHDICETPHPYQPSLRVRSEPSPGAGRLEASVLSEGNACLTLLGLRRFSSTVANNVANYDGP